MFTCTSILFRPGGRGVTWRIEPLRLTTSSLSPPQAAIGSVTGSHAWTESGEQAKAHAVSDMKAASETRDASSQGYGKAEEVAGKAVGCEGMVKEGGVSKQE